MVLIHVKTVLAPSDNNDEFLIESSCAAKVDDLIATIVAMNNIRLRATLVVGGLSSSGGKISEEAQHAVSALVDCLDKKLVKERIALSHLEIEEKIRAVRDALAAAHPEKDPDLQAVRDALEKPTETLNLQGYIVNSSAVSLYAFNQEFVRGQLLSDRIGTNEKTKVICKLALKGAGPPPREAIVSEAERNAMAAFYFKRQEELKRLADADEDDFLNSEWADPKGMKRNLNGVRDIKAPGLPL